MESLMMKIENEINSIDPGFAINQIEKIESNLDTLSRISQNINILKEKLPMEEGLREIELDSMRRKFLGILQYCESELILNEDSITRIANDLEVISKSLESYEEAEVMKREDERRRIEKKNKWNESKDIIENGSEHRL